MRQIKFRAWDTYLKRFRLEMDYVICPETGLPYWIHDGELQDISEQLVLQQFTGLLAMNGKEVYEGDIVIKYIAGRPCPMIVKWHDTHHCFGLVVDGEWHRTYSERLHLITKCEIIGNIFEHPELLTKQ